MTRRRNSAKCRAIVFEHHRQEDERGVFMMCVGYGEPCIGRINLSGKIDEWEADHFPVPFALGGEDTPENLGPLCGLCCSRKNPNDTSDISRSTRIRNKHFGIKEKRSSFRRWS